MEQATRTFPAFDTWNTIQIAGFNGDGEAVLDKAEQLSQHFHNLFNHTDANSALGKLNAAGGEAVATDPTLAALIQLALGYCERTDGLFDITVGPAVKLWDFQSAQTPTEADLAQACSHVDWRKVHVDGTTVQLEDPDAALVLGGIAKGYVADALCDLLVEEGVEHAIVNLGGNVKVMGGRAVGLAKRVAAGSAVEPWNVGLRAPVPTGQADERSFGYVKVADAAVVTSGVYERSFIDESGQLRHHILDPKTGMPVETDLLSASLVCESALDADAYATALVAMGLERALAFVEDLPNTEAVFIGRDGLVYATSGIGKTIPFELLD